jgi:hypothetical protein
VDFRVANNPISREIEVESWKSGGTLRLNGRGGRAVGRSLVTLKNGQ